jgi:uncharacterized protein
MVQINVSQQLKASIGTTRDYEVNGIVESEGGNGTVKGTVILTRTDRSILAKGSLHTEVGLTCSRCLTLFDYPLNITIEEEYFPTTDIYSGNPVPLPDETGCFTIDEHNILDLTEAIRQYTILAVPIKPLCHQDCAGLCPTCGANLNLSPCNCPPRPADPRWSRLKELVRTEPETSSNE